MYNTYWTFHIHILTPQMSNFYNGSCFIDFSWKMLFLTSKDIKFISHISYLSLHITYIKFNSKYLHEINENC